MTDVQKERLENDYRYHAPKDGDVAKYNVIRSAVHNLARVILQTTPPSREQSAALTELDKCMMLANAAIARNG